MLSVELVNAHPPKVGSETPKLVVSAGEDACVRRLLGSSGSMLLLVVAFKMMHPLVIDDDLGFFLNLNYMYHYINSLL